MTLSHVHGVPRIGPARELKRVLERHWSGEEPIDAVHSVARDLRARWWGLMREAGIDLIPCNDFSLYDHVLDTIAMVGAIPPRFEHPGGPVSTETYFAMARGRAAPGAPAAALAMTKWFGTNYHHLVPEIGPHVRFELSTTKPVDELEEARALGIAAMPVLLGPVTFLLLARPPAGTRFVPLSLLDRLVDVYAEVLGGLAAHGADWVELDESAFVLDRSPAELTALRAAYGRLGSLNHRPRLLISTSHGRTGEALPVLTGLPVEGIGLDLVRGAADLEELRRTGGIGDRVLVAGAVDGRSVWAGDLDAALRRLGAVRGLAREVVVSTSCSLLHLPDDVSRESALDADLRSSLGFARQKVQEVATLARALDGDASASAVVAARRRLRERGRRPARGRDPEVGGRARSALAAEPPSRSPHAARVEVQRRRLRLPLLPTTTIGSFPQTPELRGARGDLRRGRIEPAEYRRRIRAEVVRAVRLQEEVGLDVIVHGEPERNDMVEHFAERMGGYITTEHGWVQSYGTRCAKPPIIVGDIVRPAPMTVELAAFARSLTPRPVKGILTGPVTMLLWSFPRDDIDPAESCAQIALVIQDEVRDLEAAGIGIIQVDEPALREGLPLRAEGRAAYIDWAVRCFRLATTGVADATQIHTHMCYADVGDILSVIEALDADVISLEAARSGGEIAAQLARAGYARGMGPGVYDVHSPRVPPSAEMAERIRAAAAVLPPAQLWVNPDCGLKTRTYPEVEASLRAMVAAARQVRAELTAGAADAGDPGAAADQRAERLPWTPTP